MTGPSERLVSTELLFAGSQELPLLLPVMNFIGFQMHFLAPFPPTIRACEEPWATSEYCLLTLHETSSINKSI